MLPDVGRPPSRDVIGHVTTGLAMWGSHRWSIVTMRLSCTFMEMWSSRDFGVPQSRPWPFGMTWRRRARDHLTRHASFSIVTMLYLAQLWRYGVSKCWATTLILWGSRDVSGHIIIGSADPEYPTLDRGVARNLIWVGVNVNSNLSWVKETKQPHNKI